MWSYVYTQKAQYEPAIEKWPWKIFWSSHEEEEQKNSVNYEYQIRDYMCTFKWLLHKSFCFGLTVDTNEVAA